MVESGPYEWARVEEFLNRRAELARIEEWWADPSRIPLAMLGRRRVGKSWLFRRFAHDKSALILVSDQLPAGAQLGRFADQIEPFLGARPDLPDVASLIRLLYRLARDRELLVVIDEFPYLLGSSSTEQHEHLTSIQAVMEEERDVSQIKLILCGSQIAQMESLFAERSPLHGRLDRIDVRPLRFEDAAPFLEHLAPVEAFERFAVTGGMPMYLSRLAGGTMRTAVCANVLRPDSPLWWEGRRIVAQELREPRTYFGILAELGRGPRRLNEIAQPIGLQVTSVSKYLNVLEEMRLVSRSLPYGAKPTASSGHWQLDDPFLRFWFRFVFPHQDDLEAGLAPEELFDSEVKPQLADHVAPVFEAWCLGWLRRHPRAGAITFGRWWGNATNSSRRIGERSTEEVDAVGGRRGRTVSVVAEAKWNTGRMGPGIIEDLRAHKIPALRESGLKVVDDPEIVLFSRGGYARSLKRLADADPLIELVDVEAALSGDG